MTYFLCTPQRLRVGSIVEPGNWGRIIRTYRADAGENRFRLYRELAFEFGRRVHKPEAPSRMNCLFLCPTLAEAAEFRDRASPISVLNEVELVDTEAPVHLTTWTLFDNLTPQATYAVLEQAAQSYWLDSPSTQREALVGGAARIVGSDLKQ